MGIGIKRAVQKDIGTTPLLKYSITTNPEPLVVSPQEAQANPTIASIEIVVSNNTQNIIYCTEIDFSFLISNTAQGMTDVGTGILAAVSPNDQWQIKPTNEGQFTATPRSDKYAEITTDGLVFQIYNIQMNKAVGNAEFYIDELSGTTSIKDVTKHTDTYYLAKFPYGFYVKNFHAEKPFVNNGETASLSWIGSVDAVYNMFYSPDVPVEDVSDVRTWTSTALSRATVFQLTVKAQELGETVDLVLSTIVQVMNPDIIATTLKVSGDSGMNTLTTSGRANLNSQQVTGQSILSSLSLNGSLSGQVTMLATLAGIQPFQIVTPATYVANTDGIIIGQISAASGDSNRISYGTIGGRSGDVSVFSTGGYNVIRYLGTGSTMTGSQYGNFYLPVAKGTRWSVEKAIYDKNDVNPNVAFYWVALSNNNGQATYTQVDSSPSVKFPN